ncbi:hypothetical protein DTO207G8_832 [Paecilomyces variotii]|nr:hypothetical protein DTO207G8_832 [Paecilomyces variotii]
MVWALALEKFPAATGLHGEASSGNIIEYISFAPKSSPAIKTTATATLETSHFCGRGVNKISLYSVPLSSPIFSVYKREPL